MSKLLALLTMQCSKGSVLTKFPMVRTIIERGALWLIGERTRDESERREGEGAACSLACTVKENSAQLRINYSILR